VCWCCLPKTIKISRCRRNHSLPKLAHFLETQCVLFYLSIIELMFDKRTTTRFIADDKVDYQRDGRRDWRQTTAEHDVVSSSWAGDRGELSCAHFNGEWQFHAKSRELLDAFLACHLDWARGPPLLSTERGLPLTGCCTILPVLQIL